MRTVLILTFLLIPILASAQKNKTGRQVHDLVYLMNKFHAQPREINQQFSAEIFDVFMDILDPGHFIFLQEDIDKLSIHRKKLLTDISWSTEEFLDLTGKLYRNRLLVMDSLIKHITDNALNYSIQDHLVISDKKKDPYSKDISELSDRLTRRLKLNILHSLYSSSESIELNGSKINDILKKESEVRAKVRSRKQCRINNLLKNETGLEQYIASAYLKSLTSLYDPHSDFFTISEEKSFEASVSREAETFGLGFSQGKNGTISVSYLQPGGAAWKSNKIHKGDIVVEIRFPEEEPLDFSCLDAWELEERIESSSNQSIQMILKKLNGQNIEVKLYREKQELDENIIKSFVLEGKSKIGYISFPSFYSQWENYHALGCSNDMAKEILKLKKDHIQGLIIDLRFNGGGALEEALSLAGIFIDAGPLGLMKFRNEKPVLMKDMNRGTIYTGPLVIMVNGSSGSASEVLAGALQDHNRAIIVGSPTYGKATGQIVFPLDTSINMSSDPELADHDLGYVKITTEKLYRVYGNTHQFKGVIPDINLPDTWEHYIDRESDQPNAIPPDSIVKKVYMPKLSSLPREKLKQQSADRIKKNDRFSKITTINDSLKAVSTADYKIPLEIREFWNMNILEDRFYEELNSLTLDSSKSYIAKNHGYDMEIMQMDELREEINQVVLNDIQNDIYIDEAYRIINDLLTLTDK